MTMIQSIIATAGAGDFGPPPPPPWPTAVDPGGAVASIPGNAQLGLWRRNYNYYFNDQIGQLANATPASKVADTVVQINNPGGQNYSVMWTGYIQLPNAGPWKFRTTSDDSSFLWIGTDAKTGTNRANADIDNGGLHGSVTVEQSIPVSLDSAFYYPIKMIFGQQSGGDFFSVEWNYNNNGWFPVNPAYYRYNAANATTGF